jgi:hypothetical protein
MLNKYIEKIHIVFKTHLDVGFTDFAKNVIRDYFKVFFPEAIKLAKTLKEKGGKERFIWTTGSWLIYEYLEQASQKSRKIMEEAIIDGDITWHGLPFTTHSELMDVSLFKFGLSLLKELDRRFGKKTIAAKMTDVPGHTRGIVRLLNGAGIKLLHIGVNPASMPPSVPDAFIWKNPDDSEIIILYYKGEYGGLTVLPGASVALFFAQTHDNLGPHSIHQIKAIYNELQRSYPDAEIIASTLDDFTKDILKNKLELSVIKEEIGDTWIHGVGTDPTKVRRFRELCRLRGQWEESNVAINIPENFSKFSRYLLMIPEHTWGLDIKTHLADFKNYSPDDFKKAKKRENFKRVEASWQEQREYIDKAIKTLGTTIQAKQAKKRIKEIEPSLPRKKGFKEVVNLDCKFETKYFDVGFDPIDGSIIYLKDKETNYNWANKENKFAFFTYETFSQKEYDRFLKQYQYPQKAPEWYPKDFSKPGIEKVSKSYMKWHPYLKGMYFRDDESKARFLIELKTPEESYKYYGCPEKLVIEVDFPEKDKAILINFQWFEKRACRLPEAIWLSFSPRTENTKGWLMDKLGELVSPLEVIRNGNRKLHAIGMGVEYNDEGGGLIIESLDSPLVAPGEMSLLNFNNEQPPMKKGIHFNLYNNIWGTNFPMWFEEDARFRFILRFKS